jgi:hypothetical protein
MPVLRDLSKMDYTGKKPYDDLRGVLPEGFRVLNKKQREMFKKAKRKFGIKENTTLNAFDRVPDFKPVAVQLHRNEQILNRVQSARYEAIMKQAGYPYKK